MLGGGREPPEGLTLTRLLIALFFVCASLHDDVFLLCVCLRLFILVWLGVYRTPLARLWIMSADDVITKAHPHKSAYIDIITRHVSFVRFFVCPQAHERLFTYNSKPCQIVTYLLPLI